MQRFTKKILLFLVRINTSNSSIYWAELVWTVTHKEKSQ